MEGEAAPLTELAGVSDAVGVVSPHTDRSGSDRVFDSCSSYQWRPAKEDCFPSPSFTI